MDISRDKLRIRGVRKDICFPLSRHCGILLQTSSADSLVLRREQLDPEETRSVVVQIAARDFEGPGFRDFAF
jgi:hypothetical protein